MILLHSIPGGAEWLLFFLFIFIIPGILYLVTLQAALRACSIENRKTAPGNVWLMLIPLFNIVWQFILIGKIADSLKGEFNKRNISVSEMRPGYTIGLWMCILNCVSIIPLINIFSGIGSLVCWIIYWVKIAEYKNMLLRNNPSLDNLQNL